MVLRVINFAKHRRGEGRLGGEGAAGEKRLVLSREFSHVRYI